ncbi:PLP-dependent aminotransferase family protein [Levilactobacillus senmaizukei]
MTDIFATRVNPDRPSALSGLFINDTDPSAVSFAAGSPNESLFPVAAMKRAFSDAIDDKGPHLFQYQSVAGNDSLRAKLAARIGKWGNVHTTAANILLTVGGQQAIDLVAKAVLNPGDDIVVETPAYVGALAAFDIYEPNYHAVGLEPDGLDLNALEDTLKRHPGIKLLYTVPDFHNPTGITMSVTKREALVNLANKYDFIIIEDSPYRDLDYVASPLPAIKSFDTQGRVVFISSMSKILMPELRTGWLVADGELFDAIFKMRQAADLEACGVIHAAIDAYMTHNDLDAHVTVLKDHYKRQCAAMITGLEDYFPDEVTFTRPTGGFFDWVTLPEGIDAGKLLLSDIQPHAHINYVPATNFYPYRDVHNGMRLCFSGLTPAVIDDGMHRLGDAVKSALHDVEALK